MRSFLACGISLACLVGLAAACTSKASGGPPIDPNGSSNPSGGGGKGTVGDAAATDADTGDDGGTVTTDSGSSNIDGAACNALNCVGCCDSTGVNCFPGTVSTSCGTNGSLCQDCTSTGLACTAGQCQ